MKNWDSLVELVEKQLAHRNQGKIPGAVLLVARGGEVLFERAFGLRGFFPEEENSVFTIYDIASLTKALCTSVLLMQLVSDGSLDLEKEVDAHLPEFSHISASKIKLHHFLSHSSGLPAWVSLYKSIAKEGGGFHLRPLPEWKKELYQKAMKVELESEPGERAVYSDVGFILLGLIVERCAGASLEDLFNEKISKPLGLENMRFINLCDGVQVDSSLIAPTLLCPWRERILKGEVHDENSWIMGGVSGHAGLFSDVRAVFSLLNHLMDCRYGKKGILDREVLKVFWTKDQKTKGSSWTLGWDTPSTPFSSSGVHFLPSSVGHLGYTGTSCWLDIERKIIVVLLTNRIHPKAEKNGIRNLRPLVHNAVMEILL